MESCTSLGCWLGARQPSSVVRRLSSSTQLTTSPQTNWQQHDVCFNWRLAYRELMRPCSQWNARSCYPHRTAPLPHLCLQTRRYSSHHSPGVRSPSYSLLATCVSVVFAVCICDAMRHEKKGVLTVRCFVRHSVLPLPPQPSLLRLVDLPTSQFSCSIHITHSSTTAGVFISRRKSLLH